MPASLSHLLMHVSDLDPAREFYTDVVGLELLREEPGYVRVGGADGFHIGMEQLPPQHVGAVGVEINVPVDDVAAEYERMRDVGVEFDGPPQEQDWVPCTHGPAIRTGID